jgi:subtilase family serine protease
LDVEPRPILDIVELSATPDVIESGDKVLIEAVVRNRGNASATGQLVELMVDGSVVANATIVDLGPGNETIVSTNWTLQGEGIHSVSAVAEGDDLAASPVAVEVKAASPSLGVWAALLAMGLVSLAARRSTSGGRA